MRCILVILLTVSVCSAHDLPREDSAGLVQWTPVRPEISTGYGPIIDDLESMTKPGHPMRNESDPGNWVHELTHQVNSDFRVIMTRRKKSQYNSAYVLSGFACSLPEPKVKLSQIADMVPKEQRGRAYQLYLVEQQRYWNNEPLYVLDEATAAANALWYQVRNKKVDKGRHNLASEWTNYSEALVATVEKYDPNYSKLKELRAFVVWHNKRVRHLMKDHIRLIEPYFIGESE